MRRPIGAFWNNGKSSFVVWAPFVKKVELELDSSNQEIGKRVLPMKSDSLGYWTLEVDDVNIGDRYGYKLDDSQTYPDPASRSQPGGVQELSEVISTQSFQWQDQEWSGRSLKEMIIYELHVGTFTPEGTFDAVIDKLDYLLELGVNTIEIMPIAQFSGSRNWGYDGVFPFAVQNSYGGPDRLKRLVNACHQKGIAVFLDVVYNHIGPEGSCMHHYGPYFSTKYSPVWGHPFNFDEPYSDEVRNYFIENALMWFEEYHIDALRMDATDHIMDFSARHFLMELSEEIKALRERTHKKFLLVAERDLNDAAVLRPLEYDGYEFDGQWLDNFHHALHALATNDRGHYYADYGEIVHLQKSFEHTYVYNGTYSPYRKRTHGVSVQKYDYSRFVVFAQNHDQVGNRLLSDRLSAQVSVNMQKVIAGTYLLSPYVPLLFMGEEYGETNPFYYFINHSDLELIQAVREGRKKEFMGFQKEGMEYLDPQSEDTFLQSKLSWKYQEGDHAILWNYYKRLIAIRKTHPVFQNFTRESMHSWIEKDAVLFWKQDSVQQDDCGLLCIANFGKAPAEVQLPSGSWSLLLHSQAQDQHTFKDESIDKNTEKVVLPAESFLVYQCKLSEQQKRLN